MNNTFSKKQEPLSTCCPRTIQKSAPLFNSEFKYERGERERERERERKFLFKFTKISQLAFKRVTKEDNL